MASTVLSNGIIIPEKYSRDWYNDLYHNWQELDNLLGGGTPKDGTLTIQKNGTTVGTFSANQATNETINITVPDVNDGTLTIQQNGTTVDTFTANSSTDKTVDITVPTKTSDLTNDSNFVPSTDLATVATSGNYNDLSNKPTIPTVNNATLTIQKNGTNVQTFTANQSTNATANITVPTKTSDLTNDSGFITSDNTKIPLAGSNQISGSLIPATDNSIDIGSSTNNIKMLYTKGITINGTQFLPSNYMTLNTLQTVVSAKYYTNYQDINSYRLRIKSPAQEKGVIPASNLWNGFAFCDKNNENMFSIEQGMMPSGVVQLNFAARANDNNTTYTIFLRYINNSDLTTNYVNVIDLMPFGNGTRKLGDTNAKWKSFNGINPGALSLPSDAYIDIDTTNYAWGSNFTFTPDYDGYCFLNIGSSSYSRIISLKTGRGEYYFSNQTDVFRFTFPIYKGKLVTILTASSGTESVIPTIRVFPCQGNV